MPVMPTRYTAQTIQSMMCNPRTYQVRRVSVLVAESRFQFFGFQLFLNSPKLQECFTVQTESETRFREGARANRSFGPLGMSWSKDDRRAQRWDDPGHIA